MEIKHVQINNWEPPGEPYWRHVKENSSEPLIEATITLTLSWAEYRELLDRDNLARGITKKESVLAAESYDQSQD